MRWIVQNASASVVLALRSVVRRVVVSRYWSLLLWILLAAPAVEAATDEKIDIQFAAGTLGLDYRKDYGGIKIIKVYEDGQAQGLGVKKGWKIHSVDGDAATRGNVDRLFTTAKSLRGGFPVTFRVSAKEAARHKLDAILDTVGGGLTATVTHDMQVATEATTALNGRLRTAVAAIGALDFDPVTNRLTALDHKLDALGATETKILDKVAKISGNDKLAAELKKLDEKLEKGLEKIKGNTKHSDMWSIAIVVMLALIMIAGFCGIIVTLLGSKRQKRNHRRVHRRRERDLEAGY